MPQRTAEQPRRSARAKRKPDVLNLAPEPRRWKKSKEASIADRLAKSPAVRSLTTKKSSTSTYVPSKYTLFLDGDFDAVHWRPIESTEKPKTSLSHQLESGGNDVHAYFTSKNAGKLAAEEGSTAHMYRHVGSILLKDFCPSPKHVTLEERRKAEHVNLAYILRESTADNSEVLHALYSLSLKGQRPYPAPYIVVLADRPQFCAVNLETGSDLVVEVYVGRLLFELIAYVDSKTLFDALQPSVPFSPLPKLPTHPKTFGRSPPPSCGDQFTTCGLLRRAESVGHASLSPEQSAKLKKIITVDLYPFQKQTVRWMLDKENDKYSINQYFWEERSFSDSVDGCPNRYYYFPLAGELRLRKPPDVRGGMITEEMGLGKTVEALALIAAQKKEHERVELDIFCEKKPTGVSITQGRVRAMKMNQRNEDKAQMVFCPLNFGDEVLDYDPDVPYPKTLRVRRWPAKTTLVLCPTSLLEQWRTEAEERAPSLSLAEWGTGASSNTLRTTPDIAVGEFAKDIVLASYDALKRDSTLFKITWKRLILDEAQVTRRSSAQLARDTFNLRSESRFLMTGTPIVKGLEDLRGELAFLRVWPFTLFDDGFWERLIYCPFAAQESTAFIDHLLNVTMMRHSKAQQLSLELPPRSYEIIEVKLEGSYRAVYCYILGCCLEELDDENGPTDTCLLALRTLLRILLSACISPELLSLTALDLARRSTWSRRRGLSGSSVQSGGEVDLAKTTAEEAIQFLAETGTRIVRDSKRSRALPTGQGLPYEQYLRMNVDDLVTLVEARGLLSEVGGNFNQKRLAQLAAGGRHRIITDTLSQLRQTAIAAGLTTGVQSRALPRDRLISILTTHYDSVERRKAHGNIHEAGFAALTKLIEKKERPGCPVCMDSSVERLSLTKCGHFFCVTCISLMFRNLGESRVQCPICRRKILPKDAIEIVSSDKDELSETVAGSDDGSGLDQDLESPFSVTKVMTTISEADIERYRDAPRPTAAEVWEEYGQIASPHNRYLGVGRDSDLPSLDAEFLRHMKAATAHEAVSPKLDALHELIRTSEPGSKFCVVAETTDSLRGIGAWLEKQGIPVVGVGSRNWHMSQAHSLGRASQEFAKDPNIRVFMLNTANAAGLTLTAANCVVFMGPMVRITDEMQAAARVHRIGQQRPVRVVRIVARNTIEEQIMFRRGTIHGTGKEANALITPASELAVSDIVRLFRDVSTADEGRNLRRSARARARNQM